MTLSNICPGPTTVPGCIACAKVTVNWNWWRRSTKLTIGDTVEVDLTLNCKTTGLGLFASQKIDFRNVQCMESEGTTERFQIMN